MPPYVMTPERLKRLRESAYRRRFWEKSTGPRTPQGKARSAGNAIRTGRRTTCPWVVFEPGIALAKLADSLIAHQRNRGDLADVVAWAQRLVELGDSDGVGQDVLDSIVAWRQRAIREHGVDPAGAAGPLLDRE